MKIRKKVHISLSLLWKPIMDQCRTQRIFGNTVYSCYCELSLVNTSGFAGVDIPMFSFFFTACKHFAALTANIWKHWNKKKNNCKKSWWASLWIKFLCLVLLCESFLSKLLSHWTVLYWFTIDESASVFKGCVHYIFASLFLSLKESTCQTRKNIFYFTSKALFVLEKIKF